MKPLLLSLLLLPLVACTSPVAPAPVSDPPAIPFQVSVRAVPTATTGTAVLTATVRYGGFGSGGPARVEFRSGTQILAVSTERVRTPDPSGQEFTFSAPFTPVPNAAYQLRALVSWTYSTPGLIESAPVSYP